MFSRQVVEAARLDEDGDHPMLGGENSEAISDEIVRTPITLSPDGTGEIASEIDGVDVPIPGTPLEKICGKHGWQRLRISKRKSSEQRLALAIQVSNCWRRVSNCWRKTNG